MKTFIVASNGETTVENRSVHEILAAIGVPGDASAGYDILTDDGMPPDRAAELMAACVRGGKDAEEFARHMVKLRKAYRGE